MLVSTCHSADIRMIETNYHSYYVCVICNRPCNTKTSFEFPPPLNKEGENHGDL